jgi:hypothetical protein
MLGFGSGLPVGRGKDNHFLDEGIDPKRTQGLLKMKKHSIGGLPTFVL